MKIVIDIPEEEFGIDINDKFQDFFQRLRVEIKQHLISGTGLVCGGYELETIEMFLNAFNNGTPLPKGHGELVYREDVCNELRYMDNNGFITRSVNHVIEDIKKGVPTIIEADIRK